MKDLLQEFMFTAGVPWQDMLARLIGSVLLCGVIGYERETQDRPAGLRTHMLIGLAATVYTLQMLYLLDNADNYSEKVNMDPIRIVDSVTSGVAFLAAGMIVFSQGKVRGLTTGVSMWLAAAVGTAVGLGLWAMAFATTLLAICIIVLLRILEHQALADADE